MKRDRVPTRHPRALAAFMLAVLMTVSTRSVRVDADPTAATDDRSVTVATHEWVDVHASPVTVQADLTARKARLTRIVVDAGSSPETFTVTMVKDSGAYQVTAWWWYHDVTRDQLDADLAGSSARLIYVDAYGTPSGELFAAVMVQNTGADLRSWWWQRDTTDPSTIQSALDANNARLTEVKSYLINGTEYWLAIMVLQTGIDAKSWSWGLSTDVATIQGYIDAWHYRLISLERSPSGNFDYVLVQSQGELWAWATDQKLSAVNSALKAHNQRLIDLTPYASGGKTLYGSVMVDNSNAETPSINSESKRVAGKLAAGLKQGEYGVYLKQVGGVEDLGQSERFRFEPASSIKVLYLLYAMRQVQAGSDSLGSDFVYYPDPSDPTNPGVCPDPAWETPSNAVHITLSEALQGMMQVSDNRFTRGMALRYGIANVAAMATSVVGMSNTHLRQDRIGCLFVNGVRNELTALDVGSLYEQVDNGTLLSAPNATTFFSFMLGGAVPSASPLGDIVRQEAAKGGKAADASAFISGMSYHEKAGNEFMCVSSNCGTSPQYLDFTSVAGVITLPFRSGGTTIPRDFVYSRFGNDFVLSCIPGGGGCSADVAAQSAISTLGSAGAETYRQQIAAALSTW